MHVSDFNAADPQTSSIDPAVAGICDAAEEAALQAQMLIAQPLGADAASRLKVKFSSLCNSLFGFLFFF